MTKRWVFAAGALLVPGTLIALVSLRAPTPTRDGAASRAPLRSLGRLTADAATPDEDFDDRAHSFRLPRGEPAGLSCTQARAVVRQIRQELGFELKRPDPKLLADGTADWLDPHGLWSAAPDAPMQRLLVERAQDLATELEGQGEQCPVARALGASVSAWVGELRREFETASTGTGGDAAGAASDEVFESGAVTKPARSLAQLLGRRVGAFAHAPWGAGAPLVELAKMRYFPPRDADAWGEAVLAAAVRAYVPLVDAHGAWAPLDEEASVYEVELEAHVPLRFWEKSTRTALGVRVDRGPRAPLRLDDVVLELAGVATTGLAAEQVEQLDLAASALRGTISVRVFRPGEGVRELVAVRAPEPSPREPDERAALLFERVAYGEGDVVAVHIHDVKDDLGEELTRLFLRERAVDGRSVAGVLLDLRGNGGGSTDGAIAALGLFVPGAALFPMKRRDGTIETDRAPEPPNVDRWNGPVATLVDGDTASAAEMIAGALVAYRRGPIIGAPTFGKGCAQEYLNDDAHVGVLRLTTLLYALPDGAAVQRVGLAPTIRLPLTTGESEPTEAERLLPNAPPSWRGPDVRDPIAKRRAHDGSWTSPWPAHGGNVGPCRDAGVCRALRAIGTVGLAKRAGAAKPR